MCHDQGSTALLARNVIKLFARLACFHSAENEKTKRARGQRLLHETQESYDTLSWEEWSQGYLARRTRDPQLKMRSVIMKGRKGCRDLQLGI